MALLSLSSKTSNEEQNNDSKPVTNPYPPPPTQSSNYNNPNPPAQNSNYNKNTGHPYTAPNPYPYATPDPQRTTLFRRMIIMLISAILFFGTFSFCLWLVLNPHLPEFQLITAAVNVSTSSSHWDIGFIVKNPNAEWNVYYDNIQGCVFYGRELLSETTLAPIHQNRADETEYGAKFASLGSYVGEFLSKKIDGERKLGMVNFNVRLRGWARFGSRSRMRTKAHLLTVLCQDVSIGFTSNNSGLGTFDGAVKNCHVNM